MMQHQDSTDPTGVRGEAAGNHAGGVVVPGNSVSRARNRKANAAIALRIAGATWSEIALTVGYPTARAALTATEKALEKQLQTEDRDVLRNLVGARLDRLLRSTWTKATDEDHPEHLIALTKAREVLSDHRKLYGLDAPTEIVVHSPTLSEIEQWVTRVAKTSLPAVEEFDILEVTEQEDGTYAVASG